MKSGIIELICESFSNGSIEEDTANTYAEFVRSADLNSTEDMELLEEMVDALTESRVNHTPERHAARDFAMRKQNQAIVNRDQRIVDDRKFPVNPSSGNRSPFKRYQDLEQIERGEVKRARELRDRANWNGTDTRLADIAISRMLASKTPKEKVTAETRAKLLNKMLRSGKGERFATNPRSAVGDFDYGRNGGYSRNWDTSITARGKRYKE